MHNRNLIIVIFVLITLVLIDIFINGKQKQTINLITTKHNITMTQTVTLNTTNGDITIELNAVKAPNTVANFIKYCESGHYNNTIFHRVIDNFMVQGGGMDENMQEKSTNDPIANEANNGLKNDRGTIAMARTQDPHSATAQFFINVADNDFLNFKSADIQGWGYAVFGKVTAGIEVVDKIRKVATGNKGHHSDVPVESITINGCTIK